MSGSVAWRPFVVLASMVAIGSLHAAAQAPAPAAAPAQLPPPAARPIDFAQDVKPILQVSCVRCHARGRDRGGFSIETRERLLAGGDSGDAVVPGDSAHSRLIALVAGLEPDVVMPQKGSRLTRDQIAVLRAWIDQGATWDPAVSFAKAPPRNLARREPALPAESRRGAAIRSTACSLRISRSTRPSRRRLVDDRRFIRRVSLDAIGVLPTPAPKSARSSPTARPDKRNRLVARLLADSRGYAEHWLSFWNDLLRNDYRGTGYIDGGREQISAWLYAALANNMPYDRFVDALVSPGAATAGFTKGIVWRGVVNASQTPQMQAAQNISQVFMGVNLKCASCHDSFINDWQLADAYGLAAIYADGPLEMVECDRPTGKTAPMKFLYGELGTIDASAPRGGEAAAACRMSSPGRRTVGWHGRSSIACGRGSWGAGSSSRWTTWSSRRGIRTSSTGSPRIWWRIGYDLKRTMTRDPHVRRVSARGRGRRRAARRRTSFAGPRSAG